MIIIMAKGPAAGGGLGHALGNMLDAVVLDLEYVHAHAFPARCIDPSPEQLGMCQDFLLKAMVWLLERDPSLCVVVDGLPGSGSQHESMRLLADHLGQQLRIITLSPIKDNAPCATAAGDPCERITVDPQLAVEESAALVFERLASTTGIGPVRAASFIPSAGERQMPQWGDAPC